MKEVWKPVVGHEGRYEVSDQGRVRSVSTHIIRSDGRSRTITSKVLQSKGSSKYAVVNLGSGAEYVHEIVLKAFVGPKAEGQECRHLNDDSRNNRLENLSWGSHEENMQDAIRNGRWDPRGWMSP